VSKQHAETTPHDEHDELPELRRPRVGQEFGMPAGARRLAALKRFRRLRVLYSVKQNPMFALSAYGVARDYGVEIPEWVLEYFDLVNANVSGAARGLGKAGKGKIAPALVRALGFAPGGVELQYRQFLFEHGILAEAPMNRDAIGAFNPFDPDRMRDIKIADHVRIIMHTEKKSAKDAKKAAVEYFKVSLSTVTLALRKYTAAPSPVSWISADVRLCERSGMSHSEAISAVAAERGFHVSVIKTALRHSRQNY
jgi:hypothetical protein